MTAYEAYVLYLALKRHFTTDNYNFIQYNGKVRASRESFESRNDKYSFSKLAKKQDPKSFLLSNFIISTDTWIGTLVDDPAHDKIYTDWLRRSQAFDYNFKLEISRLDDNLDGMLRTLGSYPKLLEQYLWGFISPESIIAIDSVLNFLPYWKKSINDTMVYPEYHRRLIKYKPFVKVNTNNIKLIMKERWLHDHNT